MFAVQRKIAQAEALARPVMIEAIVGLARHFEVVDHDDEVREALEDDAGLLGQRQILVPMGVEIEESALLAAQRQVPEECAGVAVRQFHSRQLAQAASGESVKDGVSFRRVDGDPGRVRRHEESRRTAKRPGFHDGFEAASADQVAEYSLAKALAVEWLAREVRMAGKQEVFQCAPDTRPAQPNSNPVEQPGGELRGHRRPSMISFAALMRSRKPRRGEKNSLTLPTCDSAPTAAGRGEEGAIAPEGRQAERRRWVESPIAINMEMCDSIETA